MNREIDLLDAVVAELERRHGMLRQVARDSGIPYDTVLRIRSRENDPGYSKVARLAEVLFGGTPPAQCRCRPAPAEA